MLKLLLSTLLLAGTQARMGRPSEDSSVPFDASMPLPPKRPEPTIDLWTSKPIQERGPPPYVPPASRKYNISGGPVEGKINVHIVPHTHDDTGWQVTVDQYYFDQVYYVIDTVVERLLDDPNRKFMYVEIGFFARWWDDVDDDKRNNARKLVENGQLEFINGGWCMHDEASPYYTEMIDQTTRGHMFIKKNFGSKYAPKGTWSIDPFGHSNTQAWLLGAESAMQYMFWGRTDNEDEAVRKDKSRLEWIWQGSQTLGSSARIFAGELYGTGGGGYGTWLNFDGSDNQVQDNPKRHDYNVDNWVDTFVQNALTQAKNTQTGHQMWACGSDFNYQDAEHWFRNLDKLIHYVNQNGTVNAFYSTPSIYVDEKYKYSMSHKSAEDSKWEVRYDDIFPLADAAHHYWSGYFTSRPALKRQVHFASNFLNAARQMEVFSGVTSDDVDTPTVRPSPKVGTSWTDSYEGAIGVATHHDGMSGTERQDVTNDYEQRIAESHVEVEQGVGLSFSKLLGLGDDSPTALHCNCNVAGNCLNISQCPAIHSLGEYTVAAWNPLSWEVTHPFRLPITLGSDDSAESISVTALGQAESSIAFQLVPLSERTLSLPELYLNKYGLSEQQITEAQNDLRNTATHEIVFTASLPPVGYATFQVSRNNLNLIKQGDIQEELTLIKKDKATNELTVIEDDDQLTVANGQYSLTFDKETAQLSQITNVKTSMEIPFSIDWGWYNSSVGGCTEDLPKEHATSACDGQKSGAYIFRPNSSEFFFPGDNSTKATLSVNSGDVVTEVVQQVSPWVSHVIRLYKDLPHFIEVEWTVGPIPIDTPWFPSVSDNPNDPFVNQWGKEVSIRYNTGINSEGTFYTDANGKEMIKRVYNKRGPSYPDPYNISEPVAGNYYPVNSMIALGNETQQFVIVTDVTQGGASLSDGSLELMVHRRIQDDDSRGVQEPLNETMCGCNDINAAPGKMGQNGHEGDGGCLCEGLTMRGRHRIVFDEPKMAVSSRRYLIEELNFPPTLAFFNEAVDAKTPTKSFINEDAIPAGVKLETLTNNYADINEGALLLRFTHMYAAGENAPKMLSVSLKDIFKDWEITDVTETTLTGISSLQNYDDTKYEWDVIDVSPDQAVTKTELNEFPNFPKRNYYNPRTMQLPLRPMETRTVLVKVSPKAEN